MHRWAEYLRDDDALPEMLYRVGVQAFMAGQLFVRTVELAPEAAEGAPGTTTLDATRALDGTFLGMPFEEALAFFRAKRLISEAEFDAILDRYKQGGFIARKLATERLQEVARRAVEQVLTTDVTPQEAAKIIREAQAAEVGSLGITPSSDFYIDTVVRTNTQSAYGHGRWQAMNDPNVIALRPWAQYVTAGDQRVRTNHRLMHGIVVAQGSALAARIAPPCGFNCRCSMTTLSQRQFDARGLTETTALPTGAGPDPGWEAPPAPLSSAA